MGACGVVQSVELLLDEESEQRVFAEWRALEAAGLPSQAWQTAPSNRPHVTLVALDRIDAATEPAIVGAAVGVLPVRMRIGPLMVFGRGPHVLVRSVLATPAILAVHRAVALACRVPEDSQSAPGRWVPHVTLARRMTADQVATALPLLDHRTMPGRAERMRRWDGQARREWLVFPQDPAYPHTEPA
jgi:2'-5' RNA ligase